MSQSTSAPNMTGLVPAIRWCGVEWPHNPHRYGQPGNGMYADCPGSTWQPPCSCGSAAASEQGAPE